MSRLYFNCFPLRLVAAFSDWYLGLIRKGITCYQRWRLVVILLPCLNLVVATDLVCTFHTGRRLNAWLQLNCATLVKDWILPFLIVFTFTELLMHWLEVFHLCCRNWQNWHKLATCWVSHGFWRLDNCVLKYLGSRLRCNCMFFSQRLKVLEE